MKDEAETKGLFIHPSSFILSHLLLPFTTIKQHGPRLLQGKPLARSGSRIYSLHLQIGTAGRRGGRAGDYRSSVGAADAADSPVADGLVGLSLGRAYAVSACAGRDAPGFGGLRSLVRVAPRRVCQRPLAGLRREPAADGRPVARRGARTVRPFFRRPLSRPVRHHARGHRLARDRARAGRSVATGPPQSAGPVAAARGAGAQADRVAHPPAPPRRRTGRRAARLAAEAAGPVQRDLHGRQHGFRAARRLHVGLQHAGLRSVAAVALHVFHRRRADDPFARLADFDHVHRDAGQPVPHDLFPPHGAGPRPGPRRGLSRRR